MALAETLWERRVRRDYPAIHGNADRPSRCTQRSHNSRVPWRWQKPCGSGACAAINIAV
jgi:hypothetical protein